MKQMHLIGNAHLDPVWFWPWQEGYQEVKATFLSALDRMEENPDFIFTCACADYYRWVEENDAALFARVKARVLEGRWCLAGGMWVQPDMNIPSAESFSRHLLMSQRYFMEKFGRIAAFGYNVDSFGHNAMTPQFLKKAGMDAYVWMRPGTHENANVPEGAMVWESPDGSQVTAYRIRGEYFGDYDLDKKIDGLMDFAAQVHTPVMCFYGVGNHGGGPTIRNLMEIDKYIAAAPNGDKCAYSSPDRYFDDLKKSLAPLPVWKKELQHHASGCYSTHSRSKMCHRKAENALVRAEIFATLSKVITGFTPHGDMLQGWQNLLFNEFHDAMGGCSAPDVMDGVVMHLQETCSIAARNENDALQRIAWQVDTSKGLPRPVRNKEGEIFLWHDKDLGTPMVVFNPHPFPVTVPVTVRRPMQSAFDDSGSAVPCQLIRAGRTNDYDKWDGMFLASLPAMGWKLYWLYLDKKNDLPSSLSVSPRHLENGFVRMELDDTGRVTALIHKESGKNMLAAPMEVRLADIAHCDTWAHMEFTFDKWAEEFVFTGAHVKEEGPARASVTTYAKCNGSTVTLTYSLLPDSRQVDIQCALDMQEKHRMAKICFPTIYKDGKDVSEIPGGVIMRDATGEEEHCHRFICMEGTDGGLALLNDGKYSYSAKDGVLMLTLCNTSIFADHYGQNYRDEYCEYMDMGLQRFNLALLPYGGTWQAQHLHQSAAVMNQGVFALPETYHKGTLPAEYTALSIESGQVAMLCLKEAEDGQGFILRLNELTGRPCDTRVHIPFLSRTLSLSFTPFEMKTVYIPHDAALPTYECLLTEMEVHA